MQSFELPDFYVPWPARLNPNLEAARAHSKAWARQMGILDTPKEEGFPQIWSESDFDKHDYALLCAYIHPETPIPELELMTDWNVWAFYVDDYFLQVYKQSKDKIAAKAYLDQILVFMPVDLTPLPVPANPTERALADLWLRTAPAKSEAWRRRIVEDTRNLLAAFMWEMNNREQKRLANPIEYIEMRRQVGAALWSADLVEHAMFVEIPERIADTRPIKVLKNTFADAVHLRNDIFSYQREVIKQGELTNAVLVVERFLGVDTRRATDLVNNLLTARLQQFEHTVITELPLLFVEHGLDPQEQFQVLNYIRGLQDWQSGAHEWHIQTSRYLNFDSRRSSRVMDGSVPGLPKADRGAARTSSGTLGMNRFKNYVHAPYQKVGPTRLPEFYMPFTPRINSHYETASRNSKAWAHRMGMLEELPDYPRGFIWDEHRFDANDLALFNALCIPNAPAAELYLNAYWTVWGTYTDDYFAQVYGHTRNIAGAKLFYVRLLEFMPIDGVSQTSIAITPTERGLSELWSLTTAAMSLDQRRFFRKVIEGMIGGWLWELSNRIQNRIPDLIDYIEIRHKLSGSDFTLVLPGAVQGSGIPADVYRTSTMVEMNNAAIDYVWLTNDIFSYQMEIEFEGDLNNGVLIIQNFLGCDQAQAVQIANQLMTARMKQFEYLVKTELPILIENFSLDAKAREQLLAYVDDRKQFMSGSLLWHSKTGRYKEFELLRHFVAPRSFTDRPAGLGTAAMRILDTVAPNQANQSQMVQPEEETRVKTFAISHLKLPFGRKKEEVQNRSIF